MWNELSNSKMFWLFAAIVSGLIAGGIIRKLTKSRFSLGAISTPCIGIFLSLLYLKFVKLNVEYYDIKYTLIGIAGILVLSLGLGFILWKANHAKMPFWINWSVTYTFLSIAVFYIFYKDELVIDTTHATENKNIYLLLKNQDAGYYEINENGVGYTGVTGYINGFRPRFKGQVNDDEKYDHTPVTVDIMTSQGIAHALLFKAVKGDAVILNLDSLISNGSVKSSELLLGTVPK